MTILVKCKCGDTFEIDLSSTYHVANDGTPDGTHAVFIGSKKCPNVYCKLTVFVNAMITASVAKPEITTLDWDKVKDNDILSFKGNLYRIELKSIRRLKTHSDASQSNELLIEARKILYLKPMFVAENVVAEVDDCGEISFIQWSAERKNTFSPSIPCTSNGDESWEESWLESVQKELKNKTKKRIIRSFND